MIKKIKFFLPGLALLVLLSSSMRFMDIAEDFRTRVSGYYHEKIGNILFVHTNKTVYIPNESIWFKAYMLDSDPLQNEVLYVRLLNEQQQIVLQKEFAVYDIRSNGNMLIPITMAPGRYRFIAYTDKMISFVPENVFVQQIEIIRNQTSDLKSEALFADSAAFSAGKNPEITVKVSADDHIIKKARGTYRIYASDKKTIAEGKFVTGPSGVAALHFTYPVIKEDEDLFLQYKVTDNDQSKEVNLRLPKSTATVSARCYPEGGHLVNGISNRVLISVTDAGGQPITGTVTLKSQTRQVALTTTNTDGVTPVIFTPDLREKYSLTITSPGYSGTIAFPVKIDPAGYVMQLTGPPDRLAIVLKNKNMPENIILMGRTLTDLKLNKTLTIKSGDSVVVLLPQNDSANHIIDLGVFSMDNKLLAERLVYVPVIEKYHVTFHFDKTNYSSRAKVRAEIMVTDINGNPVFANLSVAVVAKQTLDPLVEKRITDADLNALRHYRTNAAGIKVLNDELIMEDIRTGNWWDVMGYEPKGRINLFSNAAGVFGFVVNKKHKKIDLQTLFLYSKSGLITIPVNDNGSFSIPAKDLISKTGETRYLIVNKDFGDKYELQIKNYSADFDTKLLTTNLPGKPLVYDLLKQSDQLSSVMSGKILAEVIVTGKKSTSVVSGDFNIREYHSPNCSDFVCFYNILNCKNHPNGGSPPVEGRIYVLDGRPIRYHGCAENDDSQKNNYLVKNIETPENFYLPDYAKEPVSTAELQSTILWEPDLNTRPDGKNAIEFYTSDIKGAFTIVVQGLAIKGLSPIFGKSDFMVTQNTASSDK